MPKLLNMGTFIHIRKCPNHLTKTCETLTLFIYSFSLTSGFVGLLSGSRREEKNVKSETQNDEMMMMAYGDFHNILTTTLKSCAHSLKTYSNKEK